MQDTQRDLELAAIEIERMADATRFSELRSFWETFLFRLERAWERTERVVHGVSGGEAQSWLSATSKLRRIDPLLQYLKQARNTETHALGISVDTNSVVSIADRYGRPFNIRNVKISIENKVLTVDLESHDIGVDWMGKVVPGDPKLQTIVNRGKKYPPPASHLDNKIVDQHPVAVAILGLNFYKGAYTAFDKLTV